MVLPTYIRTSIVDQLSYLTVKTDWNIVEAVRKTNLQSNSIMTVVIGEDARLLGCGFPGASFCVLVERRTDGRVTPAILPAAIDDPPMSHIFYVIQSIDRHWDDRRSMIAFLSAVTD